MRRPRARNSTDRSSSSRCACSAPTSWGSSQRRLHGASTRTSLCYGMHTSHSIEAFQDVAQPNGCRKLYDLFSAIQRHGGAGARAAVFFASFAFFLSQLCVTVCTSSPVWTNCSKRHLDRSVRCSRRDGFGCSPASVTVIAYPHQTHTDVSP